jgi:hypothetical protein
MSTATRTKRVAPPPREVSLADAISEAFSELVSLGEEFREICDNTPESLQSTSVYEARDATAGELESLSEPDVPEELQDLKVTIQDPKPKRRGYSRAARRDQAVCILDLCIDALQEIVDGASEDADAADTAGEAKRDAAESLRDDLDTAKDTADSCEFPGMYG